MRTTRGVPPVRPKSLGSAMRNLPQFAYVLLIVIGAIGIIIPGGGHVCIACGSVLDTILEVVAILVGIVGIATRGRSMDD
jgi:hypothetical protein